MNLISLANPLYADTKYLTDVHSKELSSLGQALSSGKKTDINVVDTLVTNRLSKTEQMLFSINRHTAFAKNALASSGETLNLVTSKLKALRDIVITAENKHGQSFDYLNARYLAIKDEILSLIDNASFDGRKLFDGDFKNMVVRSGESTEDNISVVIPQLFSSHNELGTEDNRARIEQLKSDKGDIEKNISIKKDAVYNIQKNLDNIKNSNKKVSQLEVEIKKLNIEKENLKKEINTDNHEMLKREVANRKIELKESQDKNQNILCQIESINKKDKELRSRNAALCKEIEVLNSCVKNDRLEQAIEIKKARITHFENQLKKQLENKNEIEKHIKTVIEGNTNSIENYRKQIDEIRSDKELSESEIEKRIKTNEDYIKLNKNLIYKKIEEFKTIDFDKKVEECKKEINVTKKELPKLEEKQQKYLSMLSSKGENLTSIQKALEKINLNTEQLAQEKENLSKELNCNIVEKLEKEYAEKNTELNNILNFVQSKSGELNIVEYKIELLTDNINQFNTLSKLELDEKLLQLERLNADITELNQKKLENEKDMCKVLREFDTMLIKNGVLCAREDLDSSNLRGTNLYFIQSMIDRTLGLSSNNNAYIQQISNRTESLSKEVITISTAIKNYISVDLTAASQRYAEIILRLRASQLSLTIGEQIRLAIYKLVEQE